MSSVVAETIVETMKAEGIEPFWMAKGYRKKFTYATKAIELAELDKTVQLNRESGPGGKVLEDITPAKAREIAAKYPGMLFITKKAKKAKK